jgi:ATP-dependent exoDNAse (exonuclease V) alpha subunit
MVLNDLNEIQKAQNDLYEFVTGPAGSGKTFSVRNRPNTLLTATTGIAAVNLGSGCRTLHSVLGFYDFSSLRELVSSNKIARRFHILKRLYPNVKEIVTDEVSMLSGSLLDLLFEIFERYGNYRWTIVGDFAQLPPVPDRGHPVNWAFQGKYFSEFRQTKLTRIWRQDDPIFISSLNLARLGKAKEAVEEFGSRLTYQDRLNPSEEACVIMAKNDSVDEWNRRKLASLPGDAFTLHNITWGKSSSEWSSIPPYLTLKIGARVMTLINSYQQGYVNGSLGVIKEYSDSSLTVQLDCGKLVTITPQVDYNYCEPGTKWKVYSKDGRSILREGSSRIGYHPDGEEFHYQGSLTRWPVRLAYATTCHKSQGLTLDSTVISLLNHKGDPEPFFSSPNMAYVALSRCRTLEGIKVIGTPNDLIKAIRTSPEVEKAGLL